MHRFLNGNTTERLKISIITRNPSDASRKEGQGAAYLPYGLGIFALSAVLVQLSVHSFYGQKPDSVRKKEIIVQPSSFYFKTKRFFYNQKIQFTYIMKKWFLVMFIIAIAMIGIVSANVSTLPVGASGFYDITSSPSGAAVTVDGTPVGTTPTTATVNVTGTPGHTIAVNQAGFEPWSKYAGSSGRRTTHPSQCSPGPNPDPNTNPHSRSWQPEGILQG